MKHSVALLLLLFLAACASSTSIPGTVASQSSIRRHVAYAAPPRVTLGAWANPNQTGQYGSGAQFLTLESNVGQPLYYAMNYLPFAGWAYPTNDQNIELNGGASLILSLGCGDTNYNVANGSQDARLIKLAGQIAANGSYIVLRPFWEMNLPDTKNGRVGCYGSPKDSNGYFDPSTFIAMWQHMHQIFQQAGALNVYWFFCPAGDPGTQYTQAAYYPGNAYVDINGFDIYDRQQVGLIATLANPYQRAIAISSTLPIWVGETGATTNQASYISSSTYPALVADYPQIYEINYFDAVGADGTDWRLTSAGMSALASFEQAGAKLGPKCYGNLPAC